jgi:hypothetical protein
MLTRTLEIWRQYGAGICLLAGLAMITLALTAVHLIDRRGKRQSNRRRRYPAGPDYEKPPFPVDYGPSGHSGKTGSRPTGSPNGYKGVHTPQ